MSIGSAVCAQLTRVPSTNTHTCFYLLKSRLDNLGMFQDVEYDYTVDLTGTGDRSEFDTENY